MLKAILAGARYVVTLLVATAFSGIANLAAVRLAWANESLAVVLPTALGSEGSGRVLVFAQPLTPGQKSGDIDASVLAPTAVEVAGQDVQSFGAKHRITVDLDREATPKPFSDLSAGEYRIQVVLDPDGDYGRYGRDPGDMVSKVTTVRLPLPADFAVTLDRVVPQTDPWNSPGGSPQERARSAATRAQLTDFAIESPTLSSYFGRRISMQAWVLVPKGYAPSTSMTWPVVYVLGVGSSNYAQNLALASLVAQMTSAPNVPQMIWVFLNYSTIAGTTEFVDSVNNGPWETALMQEMIPALEKRFRMDARSSGRFLTGHSSGGWASLWLQVRHPDFFAGAWATAPDPVDFHDFVGVDLYASGANMYFDADHHPRPLVREHGRVLGSLRDWVRLEEVLGHLGGTFQSFDWVFSPRAPDGSAMPMFNRVTGAVDPAVATYWEAHYDIARQIENVANGTTRHALAGKLHVTVGDQDTFYLNGAVEKLRAVLQSVGIPATIRILPGKTHNDLYGPREDPLALLRAAARDMYAIARPARATTPK